MAKFIEPQVGQPSSFRILDFANFGIPLLEESIIITELYLPFFCYNHTGKYAWA